jgi:hypothetical protein
MILGGFYLTRLVSRPECMSADLLPERILTVSDCITDLVPSVWAVSWATVTQAQRIDEASRVGIPESLVPEVVSWTTRALEAGRFGWPNVFPSLEAAREFRTLFLAPDSGYMVVSIGLHESETARLIEGERPSEAEFEPGVYEVLKQCKEVPRGGVAMGSEILGYERGYLHSWLCNGLERELHAALGIIPNDLGLVDDHHAARLGAQHCMQDGVGAEPVLWQAWSIARY